MKQSSQKILKKEEIMIKRTRRILAMALVLTLVIVASTASMACTSIFAGKDATTNGSVLISRNEDYSSAWPKHFKVHESQSFEAGETQVFYNGLEVPRPLETLKYYSVPDWDPSYGPYEEVGINEAGVAVTATNTHSVRDEVLAVDPLVDEGIGETHIPSLVLPRAESAREAVNLFGDMIEMYGSMEGYGFAIADENEVWYLEVGSGHEWAAVRVPDDKYIVVANQFRLKAIDFDDTENYITSPGLEDFVYDNALLAADETFDFAKAFGNLGEKYNTRREWWGQKTFNPSVEQSAEFDRYPVFMTPDEKIHPKEVMTFLKSNYYDTKYCTDKKSGAQERAVGIDRTVESHVVQIRKDMPQPIAGIMWLSMANPEYGVYMPFYSGLTETIEPYHLGTNEYDEKSAYWAFRGAAALASQDETLYGAGLKSFWDEYQDKLFTEIERVDQAVETMYERNPDKTVEIITAFNNKRAMEAIEKARAIQKDIITHMARNSEEIYTPKMK
jgi:dipeptidase